MDVKMDSEEWKNNTRETILEIISHSMSQSLDITLFKPLLKNVFQILIDIQRLDVLYARVYESCSSDPNSVKSVNCFYKNLQEFILLKKIKSISCPLVLKQFIQYFVSNESFIQLQEIILGLDLQSLDIHFTLQICKQKYLMPALIYIYNQSLQDFLSPVLIILEWMDSHKELDYSVFYNYCNFTLSGKSFPNGEFINYAYDPTDDLLSILLGKSYTSTMPGSGSHGINTSKSNEFINIGKEPYPYLGVLMTNDISSTLTLIQTLLSQTEKRVSPQVVFEIMSSLDSKAYGDALTVFIALHITEYKSQIQLNIDFLNTLLINLSVKEPMETLQERESALLSLLNAGFYHDKICQEEIKYKQLGFYKVLEFIANKQDNSLLMIYSYLKDPSRSRLVFKIIRNLIHSPSISYQNVFQLKQYTYSIIRELILVDVEQTVALVDHFWPSEHVYVALKLLDNEFRFKYLAMFFSDTLQLDSKSNWKELCNEYILLLCLHDPSNALKFLEIVFINLDGNSIQKALDLTRKHHILDACIYILEQCRDYYGCLDLILKELSSCEERFKFIQQVELATGFLSRLAFSKKELESFWFPIYDIASSSCFITKGDPVMQSFMQSMISHLPLSRILLYIVQIQDHATLGEYKTMIQDVLSNNVYESELYLATNEIFLTQTFDEFSLLLSAKRKAIRTSIRECIVCHETIESNDLQESPNQEIVIKSCGHVLHLNCFPSP